MRRASGGGLQKRLHKTVSISYRMLGYTAAPAGSNSDGLVRSLKFGE